ncbi:hypothetical protein EJ06DRAFT_369268 [Trichodelitschia bisporula]|uniref:STAS domain-containing protein n=1 Tax=Trichodelitschia bisporula TaxID=703511 RepID=A0A6G1I1K1_9PEZI|nr:hypothetical protein EJ06DRAFT_369268 [Trichodelitschia bisporula]
MPNKASPPSSARSRSVSSVDSSSRRPTDPHDHAPHNPSRLRESYVPSPSPEEHMTSWPGMPVAGDTNDEPESSVSWHRDVRFADDGIRAPDHDPFAGPAASRDPAHGDVLDAGEPTAHTRLLGCDNWDRASGCGYSECNHGTFSPRATSPPAMRPGSHRSYGSFGGHYAYEDTSASQRLLGDGAIDGDNGGNGRKTSTAWFPAKKHGSSEQRWMYIAYYVPFFNWIRQYKWIYLRGDFIAALTMASFYIPMALSYADNLGHVPPVQGLYSFVFNPLIYALLGTCPQMVVGPEAAGSLLTGQVVKENINKGKSGEGDDSRNAEIAGMVTFMAGGMIFMAGVFRLGFLDNVLSRPFLRGFISAIGFVIFIDQLIPELGLNSLAEHVGGVAHGSCIDKAIFVISNIRYTHGLTAAVSFGSFAIILVCREMKKRLQPRYPSVAYVPDRFLVVVGSAVLAWHFSWDRHGLEVFGNIKAHGTPFRVHFPFGITHLKYASDAFGTGFVIALLGFFESSVAAKSIGSHSGDQGPAISNVHLSANRELVALGVANIVGGLFMALPGFGGYGRSKVNASTGGRTPMSSVILSLISITCVLWLLPYFYYVPKGVLSAMISVVAYSLLEEAPPDVAFFIKIRGYSELTLMTLIFLSTVLWNIKIGIAVGIGLSVLRVVRHSTRPRIQILGRVPGTTDRFEDAERAPGVVEFIAGCLIVKIPEPLTFANTGDLRARLRRLEEHGSARVHPALPPVRDEVHNQNIIFDVHGVTGLDGAGAQVLFEIVQAYVRRGVRVFFCRVPGEGSEVRRLMEASGIVELCGGREYITHSVEEALRLTEVEERDV